MDFVIANEGSNDASVFVQAGPGNFRGQGPSLALGSASITPGVRHAALVDLDLDADLDLVTANPTNGTLAVFAQLGPAVFSAEPAAIVADAASTTGAMALAAADLNADGRPDLVSANAASGTLTVFFQSAGGTFATTADVVLGAGVLQQPEFVAIEDLDADGDLDIVCADAVANRLFVFTQSGGAFPGAPALTLGTDPSTTGVDTVVCRDLDLDGRVDLVCSAPGSHSIALFLQTPAGSFAAAPDSVLGGAGVADQARGLVVADLDQDGIADLACISPPMNAVLVFAAASNGVYPATPTTTLTDAALVSPTALAVHDMNADSVPDLVVGSQGATSLVAFQQFLGGVFPFPAVAFGGPGATDSPSRIVIADIDNDGDSDVLSVNPVLDNCTAYFNSH
jgi:hypothetical protein